MNKTKIHYLLQRYYYDVLAPDESEELSRLIEETDQEEVLGILAEIINAAPETAHSNIDIDEAEIKAKVNQILAVDSGYQPKNMLYRSQTRLIRYGIAAAAAVVLLLIGSYLLFQKNLSDIDAAQNVVNTRQIDVQPGYEGAVLILADGTEVLLDSVNSNKVITARDGSKVKIKNGQIVYLNKKNTKESGSHIIRTPKGRNYHFTLSDGTRVWLNAASTIEYPSAFTNKTRKVTLSGEAYFEVAKMPKKPFIVNIQNSNTTVKVLGTHFNVNTYDANGIYKTTLIEGSIALNTGKHQYVLKPLEQAISQNNADELPVIKKIDPEDILAWKNDLFYFNEASIEDVMSELSRWYNIDVIYETSKPTGTFTGKIEKKLTLRQALKILGATRVKYNLQENNKLIIQ